VLPSLIKFDICGDILVTRIFEEFWHFAARGKGDFRTRALAKLAGGIGLLYKENARIDLVFYLARIIETVHRATN
jgi:hypothetical protein